MMMRSFLHDVLENTTRFAEANVKDLTHAQLRTPVGEGGNAAAWILGHITYWRHEIAAGIDPTIENPSAGNGDTFRGLERKDSPGLGASTVDEILEAFHASKEMLQPLLRHADDTALLRAGHLIVHESYHVGQLGVIRRSLGHVGAIGK